MVKDFSNQRICGQSFKNHNLKGAYFNHTDIRGVDFNNAILKNANFRYAILGIETKWIIILFTISLLISGLAGILSALGGFWALVLLKKGSIDLFKLIAEIIVILSLAVFFITTFFKKSVLEGLGAGTLVLTPALLIGAAFSNEFDALAAALFAGIAALYLAATSLTILTLSIAGAISVLNFIPLAMAGNLLIAVAFATVTLGKTEAVFTIIVSTLSNYLALRASTGDENLTWISKIAVAFAAKGGTSFRGADLTNADFTQAILKNTDFRGAILTRTCWKDAKKLNCARVGDSILANASVRDLLVSGYGYKKSFAGHDLKGAYLAGADLNEVNLKEADLSEATLQGAYLEGANLTKNQSIGTNFTNAHLTGACLESWTIDSTTKLEKVDCRYFYLLEHPHPITGDRERRPHDLDKVFEPGDFEKLYKKIMNTVQILLRNGINKEAVTIAFQKLMEENPEITPDSIQAIEKKGNDVLLTLEVPEGTDKGKIQRNFEEIYAARLEAQKQAALLDAEIRHNKDIKEILLATLVNKPSSNPIFNVTNTATAESKAMSDSTDQSRNFTVGDIQGDFKPIGSALNSDNATLNISGTVAETINQLPDSPQSDQPGIKELLTQLQTAIEAETDLTQEDKAEALEQVKALAEAGKNPQEGAMQKTAKTAMKILKGTVAGLPSAAALVEACNKLLPTIASLLGLA